MPGLIRSTTPCPRCLPSVVNMLGNQEGRFETFCVTPTGQSGPHKWDDREVLNGEIQQAKALHPAYYQGPKPPAPNPVAATSQIIIDPENRKVIEEMIKQPITSGADLKGILFDALQTAKDAESELTKLRATNGALRKHVQSSGGASGPMLGPNQVIITLPEWAESALEYQAEHERKPLQEWIQETCINYLEQFADPQRVP